MKLKFFKSKKRSRSNDSCSSKQDISELEFNLESIKNHLGVNTQPINQDNYAPFAPEPEDSEHEEQEETMTIEDLYNALQTHLSMQLSKQMNERDKSFVSTIDTLKHEINSLSQNLSIPGKPKSERKSRLETHFDQDFVKNLDPELHKNYIESICSHNSQNRKSRDSSHTREFDYIKNISGGRGQEATYDNEFKSIAYKVNEILKTQQLTSNTLVNTKCPLVNAPHNVRLDKVAEKVKYLKLIINFDVEAYGFSKFFSILHYNNFTDLSQQEYNLLVYNFLGKNMQLKLSMHKILPTESQTIPYINDIYRLTSNDIIDEMSIEERIHAYVANDTDIIKIMSDINESQNKK